MAASLVCGSMGGLDWLNAASPADAAVALFRCCGCAGWAAVVSAARPFKTPDELFAVAEREWRKASTEDILEASSHHPRIGDRGSLRAEFPLTHDWSATEQAGASAADEKVLDELAEGNRAYEAQFDHIFIVCAPGKTAPEMLSLLSSRLGNTPEVELKVAAAEQMKITRLRLEKLLRENAVPLRGRPLKSPITTHVLDTSIGRPAVNVAARLERIVEAETILIGSSATNQDGRISDLLDVPLERGRYRITFDIAAYFAARGVACFFPEVAILFEVTDPEQHHHVPLLLSPFGYSTYRGA